VEQEEYCTKDQEKDLRKRTKGLGCEEDKWREAYRILFPEDPEDAIPTPCTCLSYLNTRGLPFFSRSTDSAFTPMTRLRE
jgi:hypothetical protein